MRSQLRILGHQTLGLALIVALWFLATEGGLVPTSLVPRPQTVWAAAGAQWASGVLPSAVWTTAREVLLALGISCAIGIPIGTLLGLVPGVYRSLEALLGFALSMPIVAFLSIVVAWFGFGFRSVVALGVAASLVYLIMSTSAAVQGLNPVMYRVARVYCASRTARFFKVIAPGSLHSLLGGVKLATSRAMLGVIVAEMFVSSRGLGARSLYSVGFLDIPAFYVLVLAMGVLAYLLVFLIGLLESRAAQFDT